MHRIMKTRSTDGGVSNVEVYVVAAAKRLREELKLCGWGRRHVSVRASRFALGSAIDVGILDASVPADVVREIASQYEVVERCEVTGDILGGCNRFVHVHRAGGRWSGEVMGT